MATPVGDTYCVRLVLRGYGRSWTEEYPLGDGGGSRATAKVIGTDIAKGRRLILGGNIQIIDAAIHDNDSIPDRTACQTGATSALNLDTEAGPPIDIEVPHSVHDALLVQGETSEGYWLNRYFTGLRDSWIEGNLCVITPTIYTAGTFNAGTMLVAGLTAAVAWGTWLGMLRDFVRLHKHVTKTTVDIKSLSVINVRECTRRDRGSTARGGRGRAEVLKNK